MWAWVKTETEEMGDWETVKQAVEPFSGQLISFESAIQKLEELD